MRFRNNRWSALALCVVGLVVVGCAVRDPGQARPDELAERERMQLRKILADLRQEQGARREVRDARLEAQRRAFVVRKVDSAMAPIEVRLKAMEARLKEASAPGVPRKDLAVVRSRLDKLERLLSESKGQESVRRDVAAMETRLRTEFMGLVDAAKERQRQATVVQRKDAKGIATLRVGLDSAGKRMEAIAQRIAAVEKAAAAQAKAAGAKPVWTAAEAQALRQRLSGALAQIDSLAKRVRVLDDAEQRRAKEPKSSEDGVPAAAVSQLTGAQAKLDARIAAIEKANRERKRALEFALAKERVESQKRLDSKIAALAAEGSAVDRSVLAKMESDFSSRLDVLSKKLAAAVPASADLRGAVGAVTKGLADERSARTTREQQLDASVSRLGTKLSELEARLSAKQTIAPERIVSGPADGGGTGGAAPKQAASSKVRSDKLWDRAWIWIPGAALLLLLLFLLFRKGDDEVVAEEALDEDEVFIVPDLESDLDQIPASETDRLVEEALDDRTLASVTARTSVSTGVAPRPNGAPVAVDEAPRVQSLRIPPEDAVAGGDAAVRGLLECDPRVLVEPAPRIEQRADGSLSIRFYVRGHVEQRDAEELTTRCRMLASRG